MDQQIINAIRSLGIDMIRNANSGHSGIVLGAAPILYTLYAYHLNCNPQDDQWVNRDRFILSAGHGSALLYATLYMAGYDISLEDLKNFRQIHSKTPGHPEVGVTPGVEMTTGPLGQGLASAVGMALGANIWREKTVFKKQNMFQKNHSLIDYNVYVLCGDGDLMEGVAMEAASLAGTLELSNLIVLYDSNRISLDGKTEMTFTEHVRRKFDAMGWNTLYVKDGENIKAISHAIERAKSSSKPTLIEIRTVLGRGSLLENTNIVHGNPLSLEDIKQLKQKYQFPETSFYVDDTLRLAFRKKIEQHSNSAYQTWVKDYKALENGALGDPKQFSYLFGRPYCFDLVHHDFHLDLEKKEATRVTNGKIMNDLSRYMIPMITGSADLFASTKNYLEKQGDIKAKNYTGKNIWFGVREHAMGSILNGLALARLLPSGSTYLSFADYVKPAIRLSALMNVPVTYIFTHDSIYVGQDGPTHQPIEQLAMLRSIPNFPVFRPCDAHELIGCWQWILNHSHPAALILTRQEVGCLIESEINRVAQGAYILFKEQGSLDGILLATGSEVHTAYHIARNILQEYHIYLRVVSMPCQELFLKQDPLYQEQVLPSNIRTIVIEAGSHFGWGNFVKSPEDIFSVDTFGVSGDKDDVLKAKQFDFDTLEDRIKQIFMK